MFLINTKMALNSLRGAKLRAFLTMFAVIIGVFGFVVVTTTVEGLKSSISNEFNDLGGNIITVNSGKVVTYDDEGNIESFDFLASFGASTLREKDLADIQEIDEVIAAAPQMIVSSPVKRNDATLTGGLLIATNEDYPDAFSQKVADGEFFSDAASNTRVAVIGKSVVDELFSGDASLGSTIRIGGDNYIIVGIMEEFTVGAVSSFGGPDINKAVFIPLEAGKALNEGAAFIQEIDIQIGETADTDAVAEKIEALLLENHNGEEDFTVLKQDELLEVTNSIFDVLKQGSQAISYVMIFVGAIVIMLIMLITVTERTKEIGIRKSIGATNGNILTQFLTEAIVISWFGSVIGIIIAYLTGLIVKAAIDITPEYSINTILAVILISTFIGALAGIYPSWQAARKNPIEALRHE